MPDMDGFTLAARIREMSAMIGPSILMLSSADHTDALQRCRDLSLSAYIVKPVTQRDLFTALLSAIGKGPIRTVVREVTPAAPVEKVRSLNVLLAEDNAVNQKLAIHLLTNAGHRVRLAHDGLQAVDLYQQEAFDLICMDLQMPEMGGIEATKQIRCIEQETGRHVPIIALTAHAMQGDRERCIEAGMDGYVSKPVRRDELAAEIGRVLGTMTAPAGGPVERTMPTEALHTRVAPVEVAVSTETLQMPDVPVEVEVSTEALQMRFQDDPALFGELAAIFLEDCPVRMSALADSLEQQDVDAVVRAAHTLKGAVSVLCENGPTLVVRQLEVEARQGNLDLARAAYGRLEAEMDALRTELRLAVTPEAA
jgi:CheY-like chemotaxis protein/HPt (histidine-containing phosphotransfer) domain-containing protein